MSSSYSVPGLVGVNPPGTAEEYAESERNKGLMATIATISSSPAEISRTDAVVVTTPVYKGAS